MAAPRSTVWEIEPHTRAKHEILRRYLQAWIPILGQAGFPEVLYIDGFAGPGRYAGGEDGSPIIALRAAVGLGARITANVVFLLVEERADRADALERIVDAIRRPRNLDVRVAKGQTFEEAFSERRKWYAARGKTWPPTFAFIDPFGWTGVAFAIVKEIMGHRNCEILVTFMYEEINRFIGHPDQEANFDIFFGTRDWRSGIALANPRERNRFLHDLYVRQLREEASARYVRSFEMRNESDVTDYYLFYATNNLVGLRKMKEAMWKVGEPGEFVFSDATDPNQLVLFKREPQYDLLQRQIVNHFKGKQTTIGEVEEFVLAETAFRETHYKRQVLRPMELSDPPQVEAVNASAGRKRGTYAHKSLKLRFR
jgi:three-Cys-motif partner protein